MSRMVNSALPKGESPLPTRVRASCSNSWEAASAMAWASCLTSLSCSWVNGWRMVAPGMAGVDFWRKRLLGNLCTNFPPSIQTPTPDLGTATFFLDNGAPVADARGHTDAVYG